MGPLSESSMTVSTASNGVAVRVHMRACILLEFLILALFCSCYISASYSALQLTVLSNKQLINGMLLVTGNSIYL